MISPVDARLMPRAQAQLFQATPSIFRLCSDGKARIEKMTPSRIATSSNRKMTFAYSFIASSPLPPSPTYLAHDSALLSARASGACAMPPASCKHAPKTLTARMPWPCAARGVQRSASGRRAIDLSAHYAHKAGRRVMAPRQAGIRKRRR